MTGAAALGTGSGFAGAGEDAPTALGGVTGDLPVPSAGERTASPAIAGEILGEVETTGAAGADGCVASADGAGGGVAVLAAISGAGTVRTAGTAVGVFRSNGDGGNGALEGGDVVMGADDLAASFPLRTAGSVLWEPVSDAFAVTTTGGAGDCALLAGGRAGGAGVSGAGGRVGPNGAALGRDMAAGADAEFKAVGALFGMVGATFPAMLVGSDLPVLTEAFGGSSDWPVMFDGTAIGPLAGGAVCVNAVVTGVTGRGMESSITTGGEVIPCAGGEAAGACGCATGAMGSGAVLMDASRGGACVLPANIGVAAVLVDGPSGAVGVTGADAGAAGDAAGVGTGVAMDEGGVFAAGATTDEPVATGLGPSISGIGVIAGGRGRAIVSPRAAMATGRTSVGGGGDGVAASKSAKSNKPLLGCGGRT